MIWCDGVERWLNDGMPPRDAAAARAHARGCDACTRAIADAIALEAALATMGRSAPPAPAGFTDAVMARIEVERVAAGVGATAAGASAAKTPWWLVIASEPAAAVALALVPAIAAIALFVPSVRDFVIASTRLVISSSLGPALSGLTAASADGSGALSAMSPTARSVIAVGLLSVLLWCAVAAPTWLGTPRRRGSLPRSRS
jgi:hypothetical protein